LYARQLSPFYSANYLGKKILEKAKPSLVFQNGKVAATNL